MEERIVQRLRGPDLTAANLLIAVKEVKDKWDELGNFLLVPDTVRNRIRKQHSSSLDRLDAVIKYVLELHPYVSWRLFIRALDRLSKHDLADKIRSFAEPVTDPTLTVDDATSVIMKTETDWNSRLGVVLLVPASIRDNINEQHDSVEAKKRALVMYWVQMIYNASWSTLAGALYYLEEEKALADCKKFLNPEIDDTLTTEDLLTTLEDVTDWNGLGRCLRLPRTRRDEIKEDSTYQTDSQRKGAIVEVYLKNHPSPHWKEVAWALCMMTAVNYVDTDNVKNHQSLRNMYNRKVVTAPVDQRQLDCFRSAIEANGSLLQIVMQAILHGIARSGKTSLTRVLQGKKANMDQPSTGAMDEPKRIEITQSTVKLDGLIWTPVEDLQEEAALVVQEINRDLMTHAVLLEDTGAEIKLIEKGSPQTSFSSLNLTTVVSHSSQVSKLETSLSSLDSSPRDIRLSRIIKNAIQNAKRKLKALKEPWTLYLSDIGGQLEFQELIPALTNGPSLHFIIIAAHINLNSKCPVEYLHRNGQQSVPYCSNYTIKENVLQQLATIMSTGKGDQTPKVVFFLTFKDQVTAQQLIKIDQELQEVVMATKAYDSGAIEFAEESLLCHPINNRSPDKEDLLRIRKTIERIGKRNKTYQIVTPYTWLYFGIALREVKEKVLSYDSCLNIGKCCGINTKEEVDSALKFLHYNLGVIRHFSEVPELQDIVIKEPQLLFDIVTGLVVETFTFDRVDHSTLKQFQKKGIFPVGIVQKLSTGSSLLTSEKFIAFMRHYHIIAPIVEHNIVKKYFLPCSLVHAPIQVTDGKSQYLPSLLFIFESGYTLRGVFGFLVCDLISNSEELDVELKEDLIFRDQVSLSVGPYRDTFQLTSNPMYIRIEVFPSNFSGRRCPLGEICCALKEHIGNGLTAITRKLNYTEEASHKLAFECAHFNSESDNTIHPALIKYHRGKPCSMKCGVDSQAVELPTGYKLWFNEDECHTTYQVKKRKRQLGDAEQGADAKRIKLELSLSVPACGSTVYVDCFAQDQTSSISDSHTDASPSISLSSVAASVNSATAQLDINQLRSIQSAIWDIRAKWCELGLALDIDQPTLGVIKIRQRNNPDECLTDMLSVWLKKYSPIPTLQDLVKALRSPQIGAIVTHFEEKLEKHSGL